jgi:hypothetical protein
VAYSASAIVAPTNNSVPAHIKRAHAARVPSEDAQHSPTLYIPHSQRAIARAAHRNWSVVQHFETTHGRGMSTKDV